LPIKAAVDRDRRAGRFLLTGSANVLLLPRLADTLAGRMQVITLRPLSQGELSGKAETFLSRLFVVGDAHWNHLPTDRAGLLRRVASGGYPEVQSRPAGKRREAWFASYLATILSRDMRDLSSIDALTELPRVLKALATRTANLLNYADIARDLGVPVTTVRRHVGLLSATFLIHELPAWSITMPKRLVKAPKALITDTGLAAHLLGVTVGDPASGQGHLEPPRRYDATARIRSQAPPTSNPIEPPRRYDATARNRRQEWTITLFSAFPWRRGVVAVQFIRLSSTALGLRSQGRGEEGGLPRTG